MHPRLGAHTQREGPEVDDDLMTMNVPLVESMLEERNWNWADLAREMGMSKSTVTRVARDLTRPGRKFIFKLMGVFPDRRYNELFVPVARKEPVETDEAA